MSKPYDRMIADETDDGAQLRLELSKRLDQGERNDFGYIWDYIARPEQLPPPGDWRIWMIMAGRGFGKTRSGAEWVRMIADTNPEARIALVSSSLAEARAVMVEGESGLMAICWPGHRPHYEPSLHRIRFRSGAQAQLFSAAEPEGLRGPQHSHACGSGAEGVLRQSGVMSARCSARALRVGVSALSAIYAFGRRMFSHHRSGQCGLGREGRPPCGAHQRRMALHYTAGGNGGFRPICKPAVGVPVNMGPRIGPLHANRRHHYRHASSRGHRGAYSSVSGAWLARYERQLNVGNG